MMDRRNLDCKQCGATLGQTTPTLLQIGDAFICNKVVMRCSKCGQTTIWRPVDHLNQQPKTGQYVRV